MKALLSEIKENVRGPTSDGKEIGTHVNGVDQKEKTFNQNRMKKPEFKKMRRGLRTSRTSLNVPTSESLGYQKEKKESKKWKTYLKK